MDSWDHKSLNHELFRLFRLLICENALKWQTPIVCHLWPAVQALFWNGSFDRPGFRCRHLVLLLDAWGREGWGMGHFFLFPLLFAHFFHFMPTPSGSFPRRNPPRLPNPRWRPNTRMCTRAPKIRRIIKVILSTLILPNPAKNLE